MHRVGGGKGRKEEARMASRALHQVQGAKHRRAGGMNDACEMSRQRTIAMEGKTEVPKTKPHRKGRGLTLSIKYKCQEIGCIARLCSLVNFMADMRMK